MRIDEAVIAERARYIHSNMLPLIFANLAGSCTTSALFLGAVAPVYFAVWIGFFALMAIYWLVTYWKLRGAEFRPETAHKLFRLVLCSGIAASLVWAIVFYFLYPASRPMQQPAMFFSVMLFGISAAICFASYYPAFLGTFLPFALSAAFITAMKQPIFYPRLVTIAVFIPMMTLFARHFSRLVNESLQLRFENIELVAQLTVQKGIAEQANHAKSVFLAKVSHELRTPMHAVLGYLDLALREKIGPAVARQLNTARMAGQQLVSQINDLLDYARMEHALLKLEPSSTALHNFAAHVKETTDLLALERGNQFELKLEPSLPSWVWIDAARLEQVLMALLTNAMRYTRDGRVCLHIGSDRSAQPAGPDTELLALRFEVEDTGRGIAPDALTRIFEAFERGGSVDGDGMGLGLSIAQQLLGLMSSRLEVTSRLGSGSQFGFTLLVHRAEESESQAMLTPQIHLLTAYQGRTRQVLVLDDNPINRRYLEELLGDLGFDVRIFATGTAAIAYLEAIAHTADPCPDLCIVDQHLEEQETGWDFISALRSAQTMSSGIRNCPVLMLSATEAMPPAGWTLAHGIDRHLLKPVKQQLMLQTVGELIGLEWTSPAKADKPPGKNSDAEPVAILATSAWEELIEVADSGALSALEDWLLRYPTLCPEDSRLQHLVQTLDFAGIAGYAKRQVFIRVPQ